MIKKLLFIIAIIWWIGSMHFLWRSVRALQPEIPDTIDVFRVGEVKRQEWFSIYFKGEKIGYTSKTVQDLGKKLLISDVSYMRIPVGGTVQEIFSQGIITVNNDFSLQGFTFDLHGGEYLTSASGIVREDKIEVVIITGEQTDTITFPIDGKIYPSSVIPEILVAKGFRYGLKIDLPGFDPFTLTRISQKIHVIGKVSETIMGKKMDLWKVKVSIMGLETEMHISDSGEVMLERSGTGFSMFREPQEKALAFEMSRSGNYDLLTDFSILARWKMEVDPRSALYTKFVLKGFKKGLLELEDFNQRLRGDTLEICSEGFGKFISPTAEDTAEEPFIQCNDRRIIKAVEKIIGNEKDTLEMLLKINEYLYCNIKKEYQASLPSALNVLSKKRGDCNEHTILFVAMARSMQIPARINVGLVYQGGKFAYHAWPQAWVNGRWYLFEPTFGQFPVDATHIKLLSGNLDKQVQLLRLSDVSINVVEASEKCP